jgi:hypothetical protein
MALSENARRILDATSKPGIIPGIHNYCDRWCAKCSFTDRCSSFFIEEEFAKDELRNEEQLWSHLSVMLETSLELLKSHAEELGIELDDPNIDIDQNFDSKLSRESHPIICEASKYSKLAQEWLDSYQNALENLDTLLFEKGHEGLFIEEFNDPSFTHLIEVIAYYKDFIAVKINRALMQQMEKSVALKELGVYDSNGSAKIALIAIDRSIGAWASILKRMPSREDELLLILVVLQRLRCNMETEFPDARKFRRPGFDD